MVIIKNKIVILSSLFALLLICATSFAEDPRDDNFVVAKGQTIKIWVSKDEKIHITNRSVVRVKDQTRYLSITGIKIGYTSVVTEKKIFRITVVSVESAKSYARLKEIMKHFMGLRVDANSQSAEVQGELLRFSDWEEIAEISRMSNLKYAFGAKLSPELIDKAYKHFRDLFVRAELPPVRITFDSSARAVLPSELESRLNQYRRVLSPYGIEIEKDKSLVAVAPMVEVEILVAEVQRNLLRQIGVSWPSEQSFTVSPQSGTVSFSSLEFALQTLEAKGAGRILASPKLLCRSGKEAEFLAGGEFPIAIRHKLKSEVVWKKHGVILKVKPLADLSGRMSIDIETEVSVVNTKDRVEDLPNFRTNRIKSHFDLEGTRTIALSGLLKSIESRGRKGLPILSDLPILGPLFSSRSYLEERTELVFFVTPRLVPVDGPFSTPPMPKWNSYD